MRRPILDRLKPDTAGFNKPRIAFAGAVLVVTLGVVTYLLTQSSGDPIVRTEPPVTATTSRPPRELLEDLPELARPAPPPVLRPDLDPLFGRQAEDPSPLPSEPKISPRIQQAFGQRISYSRRQPPLSAPARSRPGALPPELGSIFEDLEEQTRALRKSLKEPPAALPGSALAQLEDRLNQKTAASARQASPATVHQLARARAPAGPLILRQGTVIPAQLITEINSDLPGQVLAHISTDVRDSLSFRTLLLPRGTKLIGAYSADLATGQNRLAVAWTRLLLPDGGSIDVAGLPAVDAKGRSGLSDRVNHHTARIFGNALLLSLLSAGFDAAQPGEAQLRLSAGELAVQGASRELERAATEILRRSASIPPTVRIRAGTAFNVFLTGDLTFSAPYRPDSQS